MRKPSMTSRRQFSRRAGGLFGAGVAAPLFIPASALGRGGFVSPGERVTMGFIGVGGQGGGHLLGGAWTCLAGGYTARKEVQVLAVCDVWRERRDQAGKDISFEKPTAVTVRGLGGRMRGGPENRVADPAVRLYL
ncbi:MAG: hypothetical protein M5U12_08635 [Verrucomicrobia bacterium]|nr:hypothetical protein [Verrucomicrobiota bacterium]